MKRFLLTFLLVFLLIGSAIAGSQQPSGTLASTVITNARSYINEPTASFWSDAELLVWLNDGVMDLVSRSNCLETTQTVTLVADTIEYSITTNYIAVKGVSYINSDSIVKGLIQSDPQKVGHEEVTGTVEPIYWYEWDGKIGIYPALSSVTTETVTLYLVERASAILSTAEVPTPAFFDRALTLYVSAQAWYKSGQYAKGGRMMAEYFEEIDRYRQDFIDQKREPEEIVK